MQVLLVEASLTDAHLIREILEKVQDVRVTLAQDGIRGCQLVEGQRWDLVVTDINLPGRDGIEVILQCRITQPDTPIVATSAYTAVAYQESALRSGASQVLIKPLDEEELLTTARHFLAEKAKANARPRRILAIGALPGDVEAGCGGILLKHRSRGDEVTILVLSIGATEEEGQDRRRAAKRAARVLRAELILPLGEMTEMVDLDEMVVQAQSAVHELEPDVVFAPSAEDVRESRQQAHQAAEIAASAIPGFYAYQSASTTLEFRPTMFEDISEFLDEKMAALSHFEAQVRNRPHLDPGLARASARYWGRFLGYGEVEPLEVIRQSI